MGENLGVMGTPIYKTIGTDDTERIDCAVRAVAILLPVRRVTGSMGSVVPVEEVKVLGVNICNFCVKSQSFTD